MSKTALVRVTKKLRLKTRKLVTLAESIYISALHL